MHPLVMIVSGLVLCLCLPLQWNETPPASAILIGPKLLASAVAPVTASAAATTTVLGVVGRQPWVVFSGVVSTGIAGTYLRQAKWPFIRASGDSALLRSLRGHEEPRTGPVTHRFHGHYDAEGSEGRPTDIDLWIPAAGEPRSGAAMLYVNLGGWRLNDRRFFGPILEYLAGHGHVAAAVNPRTIDETDAFGMVEDVWRALAWFKAHAGELGVHPDAVVLGGGSSGGHVALLAAYGTENEGMVPEDLLREDLTVAGVVSAYGISDVASFYQYQTRVLREGWRPRDELGDAAYRALSGSEERTAEATIAIMEGLLGGVPSEVPERASQASPLSHVSATVPRTLLLHGIDDSIVPVGESRRLFSALDSAGATALYIE
jgi:acetyl esterase/lipase